MEWQTKFGEKITSLEAKISKLGREMDDEGTKSTLLTKEISVINQEIVKLQAEANVILFFIFLLMAYLFLLLLFYFARLFGSGG
jgi:hypothetical protein